MPRGKKPSRSQAIREFLKQNPQAKARDVVEQLGQKGIKVNAGLVYMVKGSLKSKAGRKRRRAARAAKVAGMARSGTVNPVVLIRKVRALAEEAGGMKQLQDLIAVLSE
jgi:hypothetical protein